MNTFWSMIRYYYGWQPLIKFMVYVGAFLFLVKIPMAFINETAALVLGICTFAFLVLIPFCSGSTALRLLIANNQLALVPGLRLCAGIAHLVIAMAASIYLYVNWIIFTDTTYSPLVMLRTFTCLSLFAGFMQLVLPSKFFIATVSTAPLIFVMLVTRFREVASTLFLDPVISVVLFMVSLAGWGYGLWLLKTRDSFRPANELAGDTGSWATYDGGFLTRQSIGTSRSAAGTLLLGYPDGWSGTIFRVAYYFLITPMLTTGGLYLIGFGENWHKPMQETISSMFLMFSLFSAVFCIFIYGELVARSRLVWLRYGTDRSKQWRLVEFYSLRFLCVYYLCAILVAALFMALVDIPGKYLLHYLLIIASYCYFNLYLALMLRAKNLHGLVLVLAIIMSVIALMFGVSQALADTNPNQDPLFAIEFMFLVLGTLFRVIARNTFLAIDWKLITLKVPGRSHALAQE